MSIPGAASSRGGRDDAEAVRRRAAAIVRASGMRRPPFFPERYAARCGVTAILSVPLDGDAVRLEHRSDEARRAARTMLLVDRRLPPHTPQWNGAVARGLGETLVPPGAAGERRRSLAEAAAAELLLPMTVFRPAAVHTDLTMDGLRDLAARFGAPLRLTARQWLASGLWHGFALLWHEEAGALRLWWRAASPEQAAPIPLGADAAAVWAPDSRLFATHRTGRAHHGVEEVRLAAGAAWWFVRFAAVRDPADAADRAGPRAVFAMVMLARGGAPNRAGRASRVRRAPRPEGIIAGSSK
ncbi:MAG TPA: hypothetical protein VKW09_10675 [bacterium]|nr:hypothetical protein [bacterium]